MLALSWSILEAMLGICWGYVGEATILCLYPLPAPYLAGARLSGVSLINPARAQGAPPGRVLAIGHLSSPKERVPLPPTPPRPMCGDAFYSVFCFFNFSGFVAQDGSTWPNIGPNNAGNACRTGVLCLHRGRLLG